MSVRYFNPVDFLFKFISSESLSDSRIQEFNQCQLSNRNRLPATDFLIVDFHRLFLYSIL